MDGNFSQKCRKSTTAYDLSNMIHSVEKLWVKKPEVEEFSNEIPPNDVCKMPSKNPLHFLIDIG